MSETLTFGPITVRYDSSVIAPRLWTLGQSDWAATASANRPTGPILELCCGAGHIGLAAAVLTGRSLVQVDANPAACRLASDNAEAAGLTSAVEIRCGWLREMVRPDERFPIVIADPPYVSSAAVSSFADPTLAIDGGTDGLDRLIECCQLAARHLLTGGLLSLQVWGPSQWARLLPKVPASLVLDECRTFGSDRAVVHLTRT
ncbi:MAG: hypothetical protein NVS1B12_14730 [Acidimicrobiales bacterium]